jgi:hypothetical protein
VGKGKEGCWVGEWRDGPGCLRIGEEEGRTDRQTRLQCGHGGGWLSWFCHPEMALSWAFLSTISKLAFSFSCVYFAGFFFGSMDTLHLNV